MKRVRSQLGLLALLCAFAAAQAASRAEELHGRVTRVFDGDSFLVVVAGRGVLEVRLGEIDAPEKDQPHADEARSALRALILDRELRLRVLEQDRYGRTVARAYLLPQGIDVNRDLVSRGHAWVYRRHLRDRALLGVEQAAREAGLGLWALPQAQRLPPWKWRRAHPRQNVESPVASMSR